MKKILKIKNLNVFFENNQILKDLNFEIPENVRCAIVGPNGAGKTTLIRTILGLNNDFYGEIEIFGEDFKKVKSKVAYVPQRKNVDWSFPITVYDVVKMGTYDFTKFILKEPEYAKSRTDESLKLLNMYEFKNTHINDLSGGQQQRIFVARALAQNSDLYIMDEPFTGLDKVSEKTISEIFFKLQEDKKTLISVHHDWNTLEKYFDWVIFINKKLIYNGPILGSDLKNIFEETFSF